MPSNCRYVGVPFWSIAEFRLAFRSEVDDINLGLEHFYGDFNVVHAQLISSGVSSHLFQSLNVTHGIHGHLGISDQRLRCANRSNQSSSSARRHDHNAGVGLSWVRQEPQSNSGRNELFRFSLVATVAVICTSCCKKCWRFCGCCCKYSVLDSRPPCIRRRRVSRLLDTFFDVGSQ